MFVAPSRPYRGLRGQDAWGSGAFGANRDGGKRRHIGQDYTALPKDDGVWPISGKLIHVSHAYAGSFLHSLIIIGHAECEGWLARVDYVNPDYVVGDAAKIGEYLGEVEDVAAYWSAHQPGRAPMTNHVHLEVWQAVDPTLHVAAQDMV